MIVDGIIIMLLGMTAVFCFLVLLTLLIYSLSFVFRKHALREEQFLTGEQERKRNKRKAAAEAAGKQSAVSSETLVAVISAAIAQHRGRF